MSPFWLARREQTKAFNTALWIALNLPKLTFWSTGGTNSHKTILLFIDMIISRNVLLQMTPSRGLPLTPAKVSQSLFL